MIAEFREFIDRGNLVEIAVAFVMGVAFNSVVSALTEGIVTPLVGRIFSVEGLQDFVVAGDIQIGQLLASTLNFLVVSFAMFLVVKAYNRLQRKKPEPEKSAAEPTEVALLRDIRDSLRQAP